MTDSLIAQAVFIILGLPIVGGIVAWVAPPARAGLVAGGSIVVASGFALALAIPGLLGTRITGLGGSVVVDALGGLILVIVVAVGLIALLGTPAYLEHAVHDGSLEARDSARLWALMAWFIGGLLAVPLLNNLGLIWVAIEWTTVVSALLVGITRTPAAIEAAWKYLILGSVGVGFALLGTLLAYASSIDLLGETSDALAWTRLQSVAPGLDPALVRLAFVFALVGYGTKAGLAPFHTWLPDAHSQAPSPVSATLSGATLAASLYALARFQQVAAGTLGPELPAGLLVAVGLLSLAVAVPFIVAQGDLKRLLAYSSIEHLGVCALALGFGGPLALAGLALHLLAHGLTKASLFLSAGGLVASGRSRRIARLSGSLIGNRGMVEPFSSARSSCPACRPPPCSSRRSPSSLAGSSADGASRPGSRPCSWPRQPQGCCFTSLGSSLEARAGHRPAPAFDSGTSWRSEPPSPSRSCWGSGRRPG